MFSKAKRFDTGLKSQNKEGKKNEIEIQKFKTKAPALSVTKSLPQLATKSKTTSFDTRSQCSSTQSVKSFVTPKPVKSCSKPKSSVKKTFPTPKNINLRDDIVKERDVEIRNKDLTIAEYIQEIEELKSELFSIRQKINANLNEKSEKIDDLNKQASQKPINDETKNATIIADNNNEVINDLNNTIKLLERHCQSLEEELCSRQVELASMEEMIGIRDSLCQDLQNKLTDIETCLEETKQRLEMVKGHHALALEANESIRREYKAELETLKAKIEEEKLSIINKSKIEQDSIESMFLNQIQSIKDEHEKEKGDIINDLQQQILGKDNEMKAKLEQIHEATHEKLRLCEIQFEERCRDIQEHWAQQQDNIQYLEKETSELKYSLNMAEERNIKLQSEINNLKTKNDVIADEKHMLMKEVDDLKDDYKRKEIEYENKMNKLAAEVENVLKEKNKFELSLFVTRDIVHVLTMRLRESDSDIDLMESNIQTLTNAKKLLEDELVKYKASLNTAMLECNEYKEALINISKSKAVLAQEHTRIMEHNVSLIESLQSVEIEAYRELGSIKNELIEDVELLKKESDAQIKILKDEVERKRADCEAAKDHAEQAMAATDQSRELLSQVAIQLSQLEADNLRLQQQIEDQQSLVVELSLLRQENEELTMKVAKQTSLIEKMKVDAEKQLLTKPKSPSVHKKTHKIGKENQIILSPLRERNH